VRAVRCATLCLPRKEIYPRSYARVRDAESRLTRAGKAPVCALLSQTRPISVCYRRKRLQRAPSSTARVYRNEMVATPPRRDDFSLMGVDPACATTASWMIHLVG
jgi:hypothetical protein